MSVTSRVEAIQNLLPQTQCEKCGYKGCAPYAEALARQEAPINLCHPGGAKTVDALAKLLDKSPSVLPDAAETAQVAQVAVIRESDCIGCTKCLKVCPVDAIVGAAKKLHIVLTEDCTGCELCIPACPVDCIDLIPSKKHGPTWVIDAPQARIEKAKRSRMLHQRRLNRIEKAQQAKVKAHNKIIQQQNYKSDIQAAIQRVQEKRKHLQLETWNSQYE